MYTNIYVDGKEMEVGFDNFDADANLKEIMGLQMVSGRFFSNTPNTDQNKVVVNESFVKAYGINDPLKISIRDKYEVIGVVKDFHYKSKNFAIGPLAILNRGYASNCLVEIKSTDFSDLINTVETIKKISAGLSPDFPVEVNFIDQAVEQMYQSENQFRRSFTFFAGCAIFISCIGILALSLFACQRRTKEIGIRKVNGAHIEDILLLLNKDFLKWVIIAFVISLPIAWFSMHKWLQGFAYKTEVSWWIFLVGGRCSIEYCLIDRELAKLECRQT